MGEVLVNEEIVVGTWQDRYFVLQCRVRMVQFLQLDLLTLVTETKLI